MEKVEREGTGGAIDVASLVRNKQQQKMKANKGSNSKAKPNIQRILERKYHSIDGHLQPYESGTVSYHNNKSPTHFKCLASL